MRSCISTRYAFTAALACSAIGLIPAAAQSGSPARSRRASDTKASAQAAGAEAVLRASFAAVERGDRAARRYRDATSYVQTTADWREMAQMMGIETWAVPRPTSCRSSRRRLSSAGQ